MWVVRTDVAGQNGMLTSHGYSEIVNRQGAVVQQARQLTVDMPVAEI